MDVVAGLCTSTYIHVYVNVCLSPNLSPRVDPALSYTIIVYGTVFKVTVGSEYIVLWLCQLILHGLCSSCWLLRSGCKANIDVS